MDSEIFHAANSSVQNLSKNLLTFLCGDQNASKDFEEICGQLFKSSKSLRNIPVSSDPFPILNIQGFDEEQVWQQIEVFNKLELVNLSNEITAYNEYELNFFQSKINIQVTHDEDDVISNENEGSEYGEIDEEMQENNFHQEDDDHDSFGNDSDNESETAKPIKNQVFEKTEVDDDFFSVRQMENFLLEQERKEELLAGSKKATENEIDYFEKVESSDDDGDVDLFSSVAEENTFVTKSKSRNLKYNSYFDPPLNKVIDTNKKKVDDNFKNEPNNTAKPNENLNTSVQDKMLKIANLGDKNKKLSTYEKQKENINGKINSLETLSLLPPSWQMKGETTSADRETNALLEEDLMFDSVAKPAPEITDDYTLSLEGIIKQRITDKAWDDVERKTKPEDVTEFKRRIVLDSSQSKLSLGEIYEKDYQKQKGDIPKDEDKENPDHKSIEADIKDLFLKLDALSNYHFKAAIPEPEIKIISQMPSINMEDVQAVSHSTAQTLAPEEVYDKKKNDGLKDNKEKDKTDKKRERRKKKLKKKALAKARLIKELSKDANSDKAQTLLAMKKLKNAAKSASGRTTIVANKTKSNDFNLTSSKDFFNKLQDSSKKETKLKRKA